MRAPDRTAPRYRTPYRDPICPALIKAFKVKYPKYSHYSDEELEQALYLHNKAIAREIQENRDGVELQSNLGYLFIGMVLSNGSIKRENIAWGKSIALGMKVYHKNWETDNRVGKIYYCNYWEQYRFENRHLWEFTACRELKGEASKSIKKNWKNYITINSYKSIWQLFERHRRRDSHSRQNKKDLITYNEFEMED